MFDDELKGNLTTVVKFVVMTVAPYFGVAEATRNELVSVALAGVGLGLAYLDAKHHNTIIGSADTGGDCTGENESSDDDVVDSGVTFDNGINDSLSVNEEEEMLNTQDSEVASVSEAIKNDLDVQDAVSGVSGDILRKLLEKEEKDGSE